MLGLDLSRGRSNGKNVKETRRVLEVSEQIYYRWRKEYEGLNTMQAKKLNGNGLGGGVT